MDISEKLGTDVVSLNEVSGKDPSSTDTTVVWSLRSRETHLWPTEDLSIGVKEGVLLLETEPGHDLFGSVHDLLAVCTVVGLVDGAVVVVTLAEDKDVLAASEWVFEHGDWALGERRSAGVSNACKDRVAELTR